MPGARDGGIGVSRALLLTLAYAAGAALVVALAAAVGWAARDASFAAAFEATRRDPLVVGLAQLVSAAIAIGLGVAVAFEDTPYREALAIRPVGSAVAVLAVTAGLGLAFPLREVAVLAADLAPAIAPDPAHALELARRLRIDGLVDALVIPLCLVAIPALAEELLFRGLIQPGLGEKLGDRPALALTALLFGLVHLSPIAIVYATLAGLALGWLRLRTGSVLPSIALHGAVNATPILLPAWLVRIEGFNTLDAEPTHLPLWLVLGGLLVALGALWGAARLSALDEV